MLGTSIEPYVIEAQSVGVQATLKHARELLDRSKGDILPVVDERGRTVGVISRSDLFHATRAGAPAKERESRPTEAQVREYMSLGPVVVAPSTSVGEVASVMIDKRIHHVCVEADHSVLGTFGVLEIMRAIADAEIAIRLEAIMSRPVHSVRASATVAEASEALATHRVTGVAVTDTGAPVGVFTRRDAVRWADHPDTILKQVLVHRPSILKASTPAYIAAREALRNDSRHILVTGDAAAEEGVPILVGIVTGLDLAGAAVIG